MEEVYKKIKTHPNYEISNWGNTRVVKNKLIRKIYINKYGYFTVTLWGNGLMKTFTVHKLVCIYHLSNPKKFKQINHKNGIKTDNRVENLEWCDSFFNQKHRFEKLGHVIHNRKLNKEQVFEILAYNKRHFQKFLSNKFNVSVACIKAIKFGRNYNKWFVEYNKKVQ